MRVSYHRGMLRVSILVSLALLQAFLFFQIEKKEYLTVAFLDVGQGDAIYIQAPNGNDLLVDGGGTEEVLRSLSKVMAPSDRDIDVVIATHPDKDHIGGLISVLDRYHVSYFLDPGVTNDTLVYKELVKKVEQKTNYVVARKGMKIFLQENIVIEILFPDRDIKGDTNNASVVAKISYGTTDVLLTGDAGKGVERYLLTQNIESEILKAGHHGSKTSSDPLFLSAVSPEYVIISVGKENRYGHPSAEVLNALASIGAKVFQTAEEGTIVFVSDGTSFVRK